MDVQGWTKENSQRLNQFLKQWKEHPGRKVAVFDADGTLWSSDLGEGFFKYQIENKLIPKNNFEPDQDLWKDYLELSHSDPLKAYGWLAQLQKGVAEDQVLLWSRNYFERTFKKHVFMDVAKLILALRRIGFEIWVCSASIRWALQPAIQALQVDHLIAVETRVEKGVITDQLIEPLPYKSGKRTQLEKALQGVAPLLVAGNSMGDLAMLEISKSLGLVINSAEPSSHHYESEQQLLKEAQKRNWLIQKFE